MRDRPFTGAAAHRIVCGKAVERVLRGGRRRVVSRRGASRAAAAGQKVTFGRLCQAPAAGAGLPAICRRCRIPATATLIGRGLRPVI